MVRPINTKHIKDKKAPSNFQKESLWSLLPSEELWRDRYNILQRNGYLLRSRFRPDWIPSWTNTDLNPFFCEDAFGAARPQCIDATRMKDGVFVFIKRVSEDADETEIQRYLSDGQKKDDPKNHCCPILDVFRDAEDEGYEYVVLPVLRVFDDPKFYAVIEVLDFVKQTLEGLKYMHEHQVAHCDCAAPNIMMDGLPLFPEGFHPAHQYKHPSYRRYAKKRKRLYASPVKCYFIDFGLSVKKNEEWGVDPLRWYGVDGHEESAPEIFDYDPRTTYNAYVLDVFILGKVYDRSFLQRFSNIDILRPIVEGMTRQIPDERLTLDDALAMLSTATRTLNIFRLRSRLHPKTESKFRANVNDLRAFLTDIPHLLEYQLSRWLSGRALR